jgi:hypothetical protein
MALNLVSVIIGHYQMEWLLSNDGQGNVLLRLVINLATIEVRVILESLALCQTQVSAESFETLGLIVLFGYLLKV